jgi:alpha-D-xyloside xylohydrolase
LSPRPDALATFLDPPRPVELAARVETSAADASGLDLRIATERWEPELRDYYGTLAETVLRPPAPGRRASARIEIPAAGIVRLRYAAGDGGVPDHDTPMLDGRLEGIPAEVSKDEDILVLTAEGVQVRVACDPFCVSLLDAAGRVLWCTRPIRLATLERHSTPEWSWLFYHRYAYPLGVAAQDAEPAAFASFEVAHDERLHGLGEGFGPLDKRFARHDLWAREGFSNATPGVYKPIPFWLSTRNYGVFVNTSHPLTVDLGAREHSAGAVTVTGAPLLDLWLVTGDTPAAVLERYSAITGRPRVPPRWSFGLWMGRISYDTQEQVETVARELREHAIPADVIHVDTNWFREDWACDWQFSPERFPDPAGMLSRLREQGFRVSLWQWPIVLERTRVWAEARADGHLALGEDGEPHPLPGPEGSGGLIDFARAETVAWYQDKLRALHALGVGAIKADFGEGAPPQARYDGVPGDAMHALYPLLYNRAAFEASDAGIIWARSAWAGSQRYPLHWSGDGIARWQDLPLVLRSTLSFGLSGFPFYAHDIGGFSGIPTPKLYVRWAQLALLSSHARAHGHPPREPWAYGACAEAIVRTWAELRARLIPYLWAEALRCGQDATPLVRALLLDFADDPVARAVDDQYMLGRSLLVAPVLDARDCRQVYLPPGRWVDFRTQAVLDGGRHMDVSVPLECVPLYVRAGAILPLGPLRQHTEEPSDEPLTVGLYAPEGEGEYVLHEPEGLVRLAYRVEDGAVHVTAPPEARVVVHGADLEVVR